MDTNPIHGIMARTVAGWFACLGLAIAALLVGSTVMAKASSPTTAHAAKIEVHPPKSQLECEKEYGLGTSWHRCFNEPPGSSCNHPLEVQKAGETTRGDAQDFKTTFREEAVGGINFGAEQYYSWAPKKGIAMCPYPDGAIYKVSLETEEYCEIIHGKKYCSGESGTKNIPEHSGPHGGSFEYLMTDHPLKSFYLVIRGYYVHPPRVKSD